MAHLWDIFGTSYHGRHLWEAESNEIDAMIKKQARKALTLGPFVCMVSESTDGIPASKYFVCGTCERRENVWERIAHDTETSEDTAKNLIATTGITGDSWRRAVKLVTPPSHPPQSASPVVTCTLSEASNRGRSQGTLSNTRMVVGRMHAASMDIGGAGKTQLILEARSGS